MDSTDHQRLIAELDTLLAQIATLLQRFESCGLQSTLKSDYLALHALQAQACEQRLSHLQALGTHGAIPALPSNSTGTVH